MNSSVLHCSWPGAYSYCKHATTHFIKADPQTGSIRLGVGLQRVKGGRGIPVHMHEKEDEVLFVHSGSGVGAVGDEQRSVTAGTTLYIPQGTWHGIESRSDVMEILWVVSPPNFAQNLRARAVSGGEQISSGDLQEIARTHGIRDTPDFFLPRLAVIAAILACAAVFIALLSRVHPFRVTAVYALGRRLERSSRSLPSVPAICLRYCWGSPRSAWSWRSSSGPPAELQAGH